MLKKPATKAHSTDTMQILRGLYRARVRKRARLLYWRTKHNEVRQTKQLPQVVLKLMTCI